MGVKGKGGIKMEAKVSNVLRVGGDMLSSEIGGGSGRVDERRGKWRKNDSVLVVLSFRELEVSHCCCNLIQEESRSGAYVGESLKLIDCYIVEGRRHKYGRRCRGSQ